jgi:hypothetical protein
MVQFLAQAAEQSVRRYVCFLWATTPPSVRGPGVARLTDSDSPRASCAV